MSPLTATTSTIEGTVRAYFTAWEDADPAAAAALFTADARIMPDEMPTIAGPAAMQAVVERFLQAFRMVPEQLDLDRTETRDGYAVVESRSVERLTNLADGSTTTIRPRELFVLVGTAEGWRIKEYMFNRAGA